MNGVLLFLGDSSASASILRGLWVTGEWLNQDPATCEKRVMGEILMLEGVLGLEEESLFICAMEECLEGAMIHDLHEMKEAENRLIEGEEVGESRPAWSERSQVLLVDGEQVGDSRPA
jgi:hypothetical protein